MISCVFPHPKMADIDSRYGSHFMSDLKEHGNESDNYRFFPSVVVEHISKNVVLLLI